MDRIAFLSLDSSEDSKEELPNHPEGDHDAAVKERSFEETASQDDFEDDDTNDNDNNNNGSKNAIDKYGYEEAVPDVQYYNNNRKFEAYCHDPDEPIKDTAHHNHVKYDYDRTRVPRRSSLKGSLSSYSLSSSSSSSSSHSSSLFQHRRCASMGSPTTTSTTTTTTTTTTTIEVYCRGHSKPIQRRRSVDFDNQVHVKEVPPILSLTENVGDLWLQPRDFVEMKRERESLVSKVRNGQVAKDNHGNRIGNANTNTNANHNPSSDDYSLRGLEKYIDIDDHNRSRIIKHRAWDTVLLEQDEQEILGDYDEQKIADLYKETTFASPEKAFVRAQQDEEAVKDYLKSPQTTRLMTRRLSC